MKNSTVIQVLSAISIAFLMNLFSIGATNAAIVYVDVNATGSNNGSSWNNAYTDLQDALDYCSSGDEIRVAQGTYFPSQTPTGSTSDLRNKSFHLANREVNIRGGWKASSGTQTGGPSILSGDIGTKDDPSDNAYHVMVGVNLGISYFENLVIEQGNSIDGNLVTPSYSYVSNTISRQIGAGIYLIKSRCSFQECIFRNNKASVGGGLHQEALAQSSLRLVDCKFDENSGTSSYAAVYFSSNRGNLIVDGCSFQENSGKNTLIRFYANGGNLVVTNCFFIDNYSNNNVLNAQTGSGESTLNNCQFIGNTNTSGTNMVLYADYSGKSDMYNCKFSGNTSASFLLYMYGNGSGSHKIRNCNFTNNSGMHSTLYLPDVAIYNSVFFNNTTSSGYEVYQFGYAKWDNIAHVLSSSSNNAGPGGLSYLPNSGTNVDLDAYSAGAIFSNLSDPEGNDNTLSTTDDGSTLADGSPLFSAASSSYAPSTDITGTTHDNPPAIGAYAGESLSSNPCNADTENPTIADCPSNISRSNDAGSCGAKVTWIAPTASDNCGATLSSSHNSGDYFSVGTTTVTYTAEDAAGNKATCSFDVTVTDDELPNVVTQSASVTLSGGSASISVSDIDNGSNDNCGIEVMSVEPSSFSCNDLGTQTVTLTVKDIHGNVNTGTAAVTINGAAPSCSISSAPNASGTVIGSMTTYAATNQMFLGYGAQSMNITCSTSGGSSFNYSWSGSGLSSSSVANPVFTPSAPGNYTLTCTITNEYGCEATCSIVICVMDARGSGGSAKNPKVTICHVPQGNSGNPQTLSISVNAVAAHVGNHGGCTLGACDASCDDNSLYKYDTQADFYYMGYGEDDLDLMVYPNPSTSDFAFVLESPFSTEVQLSIYDLSGRLIEKMNNLSAHTEQRFGVDLPVGVYMVSIHQEGYSKTFKVVKFH